MEDIQVRLRIWDRDRVRIWIWLGVRVRLGVRGWVRVRVRLGVRGRVRVWIGVTGRGRVRVWVGVWGRTFGGSNLRRVSPVGSQMDSDPLQRSQRGQNPRSGRSCSRFRKDHTNRGETEATFINIDCDDLKECLAHRSIHQT